MKAQMIEKNGFPKPIGFMIIFILISLVCLFSQAVNANNTGEKFDFSGVEKTTEIQVGAYMVNENSWN